MWTVNKFRRIVYLVGEPEAMDKMKVEDEIDNNKNKNVTEQRPPLGAWTIRWIDIIRLEAVNWRLMSDDAELRSVLHLLLNRNSISLADRGLMDDELRAKS